MFSQKTHNFQDGLGQTYAFTLRPQLDPEACPRPEAVVRCKVYARQTLNSIVEAHQDPFHYGLMDLWLDAFQKPWARPRDLNQLVDDLAGKMAGGELFVYLEDSPVWHHLSSNFGGGAPSLKGDAPDRADSSRVQKQTYIPHDEVKQARTGDRIFKRIHPDGHARDSYTLLGDGKPMGADEGTVPERSVGMKALPDNHDMLVNEGWPTLNFRGSATYETFTRATPVILPPGTRLFRLVDELNPDAGGFWAYELPKNKTVWRRDYAVKDSWNDDGYYVQHTVGPGGLKAWEGPAAAQPYRKSGGRSFYLSGGGKQLFITPNSIEVAPPKLTDWPEV